MDSHYRPNTVRPTPNSKSRNRIHEEDNYMTLPDHEIAGCISDIGIPFSTHDLHKPNPQQIQKVFEWFAELLMNTTRDVVAPAMRAAAEDVCGPYAEIFSADTRDLLGFFVTLRKLLVECGIHDFQLQDLYRPTRERLVRIFSYIINFIRFRESQTSTIDEHFNKAEKTKQRIEVLYVENQAKEETLMALQRNKKATEAAVLEKEARSEELKSRLRQLKSAQDAVAQKLEKVRQESARLKAMLEEKAEQKVLLAQEAEKLRPYTTQSPAALEASLKELNGSLNSDKAQIELLDRRARALQASCEAFRTVTADIEACTTLLHELQRDMAAEEAILTAAAKNRDALSERSNNVRDVDRQERQLQKQLETVLGKTEKLNRREEERKREAAKRVEELDKIYKELKQDRAESSREIERRRVKIEQTEKKMADLKEHIEAEIHSAHDEYLKMESHIKLYIREMEQSIS